MIHAETTQHAHAVRWDDDEMNFRRLLLLTLDLGLHYFPRLVSSADVKYHQRAVKKKRARLEHAWLRINVETWMIYWTQFFEWNYRMFYIYNTVKKIFLKNLIKINDWFKKIYFWTDEWGEDLDNGLLICSVLVFFFFLTPSSPIKTNFFVLCYSSWNYQNYNVQFIK